MQPDFQAPRLASLVSLMSCVFVLAACGGGAAGDSSAAADDASRASSSEAAAEELAQASRRRRPATAPEGTAPAPTPVAPPAAVVPGPGPAITNFAVLSWTPPVGPVTGYRVYYGTSSRNYQQALGSGVYAASKEMTLLNLLQGTTYYFAVTAIDAAGQESAFSAEGSKLIP